MAKTNPITFIKQVRSETAKVTWPNHRETVISTVLVFVMALLAGFFLFFADRIIDFGLWQMIGFFERLF